MNNKFIKMTYEEVRQVQIYEYLFARYDFISKLAKDKPDISNQQKLQWVNSMINYRIAYFTYRDELFKIYNVPVDTMTWFRFNLDEEGLYYRIKEEVNPDA